MVLTALIGYRAFFVLTTGGVLNVDAETTVDQKKQTEGLDSRSMGLLEPSMIHQNINAIGGGEIDIVEDSALVAYVGPEGTGADIIAKNRATDEISLYAVKEGDTLSQVAEMFGVSENTIMWANDLSSKVIGVGDVLVILPVTGISHKVKKGETVSSIAKKYNADLIEVARYNGKDTDDSLSVGEVIIVPDGEMSTPHSKKAVSGRSSSSVSGYFIRPVHGVKTQGIHGYNAVDIGASVGTSVYAAAAGKVIISKWGGWNGGYGNYIVIKHDNGTQTLYSHLSQNNVGVGEWVGQGQVIGRVGSTGRSTGPHLHFEVRGTKNPF